MAVNLERFKKDLDRLIDQGEMLHLAMQKEAFGEKAVAEALRKAKGPEAADATLSLIPRFDLAFEGWYSESLALIRQLLPDRLSNFIAMYEKPKGRKSVQYGDYVIQDYLQGYTRTDLDGKVTLDRRAAIPQFRQQMSILVAAKRRFESSLFEIRQLVQADLFDSEIEAARELLKNRFLRAAGAVTGVVLEKHLHQVCDDHHIKVAKKNPGIADLNELLKSNSVIEMPQWRHISMLADLRNLCDHNKNKEPSAEQVTDLIDGTDKVLKTVA